MAKFLLALCFIGNNNIEKFKQSQLTKMKSSTDQFMIKHTSYKQTYKNIPVEFSTIKERKTMQQTSYYGKPVQLSHFTDSLVNLLSEKNQFGVDNVVLIDPSFQQKTFQLAYKFFDESKNCIVYKSVQNGKTIFESPVHHSCKITTSNGMTNSYGNQIFDVCLEDNLYNTTNYEKHIYLWNAGSNSQVSASNIKLPFSSNSNFFSDQTTTTIYWAIDQTSDYLTNTHNWFGLDGDNFPIECWVVNNSSFQYNTQLKAALIGANGRQTIDIIAHEIMHGLTDLSSSLVYFGQPGALNESFSDIFGELVENYTLGTNDWLVHSDIHNVNNAIRDFATPSNFFQPDTFLVDQYWYDGFSDCGGVHINSGVHNHWFYLLAVGGKNVTGIGLEKAAAIVFRNLTYYLFPTAHFTDAKTGSLQAAEDLYGVNSYEKLQVQKAWEAIGVFDNTEIDSLALISIYSATEGQNWHWKWDLNKSMDFWYGIILNNDRRVTHIDLSSNNLTQYLPFEIGNLTALQYLDLSNNPTQRTLIFEIGNLKKLQYLDLSNSNQSLSNYNFCSDDYYLSALTSLTDLAYLDISDNGFTGCYPFQLRLLKEQIFGLNNIFISNGNNFDTDWDDFITNNNGNCNSCLNELTIEEAYQLNFLPPISNALNTQGNIILNHGAAVSLFAGNKIILNSGFEVKENTNLLINIKYCTN